MMDLGEARAIVANMKAKYASFARLEEAIVAVDQASSLLDERQAALVKVNADIEAQTAELSEFTNKANLAKDALTNAEAAYAKRSFEMDQTYTNRRQEIANDLKNAEKEAEQAKAAMQDEINALADQKRGLDEQLDGLKRKIAEIRASLNISGT